MHNKKLSQPLRFPSQLTGKRFLQECTSAVSIDAEEQLYKAAVEQDITTITISQRNTLPVRPPPLVAAAAPR